MKKIFLLLNLLLLITSSLIAQVPVTNPPPPPPPPPPPVPETEEIFQVIEAQEFPVFPGCSNDLSVLELRHSCSNEKLKTYIEENLVYPELAIKHKVEGRVVIQFVVEKDGSVTKEKILKDIGAGCGKAALAVFKKMREENITWQFPKRKRSRPIKVQMNAPVEFVLPE